MKKILCLSILLLVSFGCANTATFDKAPSITEAQLKALNASKITPDDIDVLDEPPSTPYIVLGTLRAPKDKTSTSYPTEDLVGALRKKAAAVGGHAIINIRNQRLARGSVSSADMVSENSNQVWGEVILLKQ